jgi:biopolymer transport protein ExbD
MRIHSRGAAPAKVDVQLTPMIDVVFQLLAFFLVTFKVAAVEGDFSLKLPARDDGFVNAPPTAIDVRLSAADDGDLRLVAAAGGPVFRGPAFGGGEANAGFSRLARYIADRVAAARAAGQEEPEVRITADDGLRYEHVVDAVAAASVYVDDDGRPVPSARRVSLVGPSPR